MTDPDELSKTIIEDRVAREHETLGRRSFRARITQVWHSRRFDFVVVKCRITQEEDE